MSSSGVIVTLLTSLFAVSEFCLARYVDDYVIASLMVDDNDQLIRVKNRMRRETWGKATTSNGFPFWAIGVIIAAAGAVIIVALLIYFWYLSNKLAGLEAAVSVRRKSPSPAVTIPSRTPKSPSTPSPAVTISSRTAKSPSTESKTAESYEKPGWKKQKTEAAPAGIKSPIAVSAPPPVQKGPIAPSPVLKRGTAAKQPTSAPQAEVLLNQLTKALIAAKTQRSKSPIQKQ